MARLLVSLAMALLVGCGGAPSDEQTPWPDRPVNGEVGSLPLPDVGETSRTISGRIAGLAPGEHVLVLVRGERVGRATTRLDGIWQVDDLPPGLYDVVPIHQRYLFDPPSRRVSIREGDLRSVRFTATVREKKAPAGEPLPDTGLETGSMTHQQKEGKRP